MNRGKFFSLTLSMVLMATVALLPENRKAQEKPQYYVGITDPDRDGLQKGHGMNVEGKASIPLGEHLWVLVRRVDFEGFWWPQGEGKIDPNSLKWKVPVIFGQLKDVGWEFDITAITVNETEHIKLMNYRKNAMEKNIWSPIEMPPTTLPPQYRKVMKISDN